MARNTAQYLLRLRDDYWTDGYDQARGERLMYPVIRDAFTFREAYLYGQAP